MAQKKKARIKQRRLNLADRIIASALTASTILTPLSAAASELTVHEDYRGKTTVNQNGSKYTVTTSKKSTDGKSAFNRFSKFELSQGHIANMVLPNGTSKLYNFVDAKIDVQGTVNALKAEAKKIGGHLIFISPKGMIIGEKGAINAGQFSAIIADDSTYKTIAGNNSPWALTEFKRMEAGYVALNPEGSIFVKGKVTAPDGITLKAAQIETAKGSKLNTASLDFSSLVNVSDISGSGIDVNVDSLKLTRTESGDVRLDSIAVGGKEAKIVHSGDINAYGSVFMRARSSGAPAYDPALDQKADTESGDKKTVPFTGNTDFNAAATAKVAAKSGSSVKAGQNVAVSADAWNYREDSFTGQYFSNIGKELFDDLSGVEIDGSYTDLKAMADISVESGATLQAAKDLALHAESYVGAKAGTSLGFLELVKWNWSNKIPAAGVVASKQRGLASVTVSGDLESGGKMTIDAKSTLSAALNANAHISNFDGDSPYTIAFLWADLDNNASVTIAEGAKINSGGALSIVSNVNNSINTNASALTAKGPGGLALNATLVSTGAETNIGANLSAGGSVTLAASNDTDTWTAQSLIRSSTEKLFSEEVKSNLKMPALKAVYTRLADKIKLPEGLRYGNGAKEGDVRTKWGITVLYTGIDFVDDAAPTQKASVTISPDVSIVTPKDIAISSDALVGDHQWLSQSMVGGSPFTSKDVSSSFSFAINYDKADLRSSVDIGAGAELLAGGSIDIESSARVEWNRVGRIIRTLSNDWQELKSYATGEESLKIWEQANSYLKDDLYHDADLSNWQGFINYSKAIGLFIGGAFDYLGLISPGISLITDALLFADFSSYANVFAKTYAVTANQEDKTVSGGGSFVWPNWNVTNAVNIAKGTHLAASGDLSVRGITASEIAVIGGWNAGILGLISSNNAGNGVGGSVLVSEFTTQNDVNVHKGATLDSGRNLTLATEDGSMQLVANLSAAKSGKWGFQGQLNVLAASVSGRVRVDDEATLSGMSVDISSEGENYATNAAVAIQTADDKAFGIAAAIDALTYENVARVADFDAVFSDDTSPVSGAYIAADALNVGAFGNSIVNTVALAGGMAWENEPDQQGGYKEANWYKYTAGLGDTIKGKTKDIGSWIGGKIMNIGAGGDPEEPETIELNDVVSGGANQVDPDVGEDAGGIINVEDEDILDDADGNPGGHEQNDLNLAMAGSVAWNFADYIAHAGLEGKSGAPLTIKSYSDSGKNRVIAIDAQADKWQAAFSGGAAIALSDHSNENVSTVGVGGSLAVNSGKSVVSADLGNSTVIALNAAGASRDVISLSAGSSGRSVVGSLGLAVTGGDSDKGAGIAANVSANTLNNSAKSSVFGVTTSADAGIVPVSTDLDVLSYAKDTQITGAVDLAVGKAKAAVGAGIQVAVIKNDIGSSIADSTMENLGAVSVDSYLGVTQVVAGLTVAAGVGDSDSAWSYSGALVVDTLINRAAAKILSSDLTASGSVHIAAGDGADIGACVKQHKASTSFDLAVKRAGTSIDQVISADSYYSGAELETKDHYKKYTQGAASDDTTTTVDGVLSGHTGMTVVTGALTGSGTSQGKAAGTAIVVNNLRSSMDVQIENSSVKADALNVNSENGVALVSVAAGAAVGGNGWAVDGSVVWNSIVNRAGTTVKNSNITITGTNPSSLTAQNRALSVGVAGAVGVAFDKLAAGVALGYAHITNDAVLSVSGSANKTLSGTGGSLSANAENSANSWLAVLAVPISTQGGAGGGTASLHRITGETSSIFDGLTITGLKDLDITAQEKSSAKTLAGAVTVSTESGAVAGALTVTQIGVVSSEDQAHTLHAALNSSDVVMADQAGRLNVSTSDDADIFSIALGGGYGSKFSASGAVTVNLLHRRDLAEITGTCVSGEQTAVSVTGKKNSLLTNIGVEIEASQSGAGGGAIVVNRIGDENLVGISGRNKELDLGGLYSLASSNTQLLNVEFGFAGAAKGAGQGMVLVNSVSPTTGVTIEGVTITAADSLAVLAMSDAEIRNYAGQGAGAGNVAGAGLIEVNYLNDVTGTLLKNAALSVKGSGTVSVSDDINDGDIDNSKMAEYLPDTEKDNQTSDAYVSSLPSSSAVYDNAFQGLFDSNTLRTQRTANAYKGLVVDASSTHTLTNAALVGAGSGGGAGAGSINVDVLTGSTTAQVLDSDLSSSSDVSVHASDFSNVSGVFITGAGGQGAGAGIVNVRSAMRDVDASIKSSSLDVKHALNASGTAAAGAVSKQSLTTFAIAGAGGMGAGAGVVEVDVQRGTTTAFVDGVTGTVGALGTTADHFTRVGQIDIAGSGGEGAGALMVSVGVDKSQTAAQMRNASLDVTGGNVVIDARNRIKGYNVTVTASGGIGAGTIGVGVNYGSAKIDASLLDSDLGTASQRAGSVYIGAHNTADLLTVAATASGGVGAGSILVNVDDLYSDVGVNVSNSHVYAENITISADEDYKLRAHAWGASGGVGAGLIYVQAINVGEDEPFSDPDYDDQLASASADKAAALDKAQKFVSGEAGSVSTGVLSAKEAQLVKDARSNDADIRQSEGSTLHVSVGETSLLDASKNISIAGVESTDIISYQGGFTGGVGAGAVNLGFMSVRKQAGVVIDQSKLVAGGTLNVSSTLNGHNDQHVIQGIGGVGVAFAAYGRMTAKGAATITAKSSDLSGAQAVSLRALDAAVNESYGAGGTLAGVPVGGIVARTITNDDVRVTVDGGELRSANGTVTLDARRTGETYAQEVFGYIGGVSGLGADAKASESTDVAVVAGSADKTVIIAKKFAVHSELNPDVHSRVYQDGGSVFASVGVPLAEAVLDGGSAVTLGAKNAYNAPEISVESFVGGAGDPLRLFASVHSYGGTILGVDYQYSRAEVTNDTTATIDMRGGSFDSDPLSALALHALNNAEVSADMETIRAGVTIASMNNAAKAHNFGKAFVNMTNGSEQLLASLEVKAESASDSQAKANGDGGGAAYFDDASSSSGGAKAAWAYTSIDNEATVSIGGSWKTSADMKLTASQRAKTKDWSDAVIGGAVAGNGTQHDLLLTGKASVSAAKNSVLRSGGAMTLDASNVLKDNPDNDYTSSGNTYGAVVGNGTKNYAKINQTASVNVGKNSALESAGAMAMTTHASSDVNEYARIVSGGAAAGSDALNDFRATWNDSITIESGANLMTHGDESDITLAAWDDAALQLTALGDMQGGVIGGATSKLKITLDRTNAVKVSGSLNAGRDVNLWSGQNVAGDENTLDLKAISHAYAHGPITGASASMERTINQNNTVTIDGSADSTRHTNLVAQTGDIIKIESTERYAWTSSKKTGSVSSTALGDTISGLNENNSIAVNGSVTAGVKNKFVMDISQGFALLEEVGSGDYRPISYDADGKLYVKAILDASGDIIGYEQGTSAEHDYAFSLNGINNVPSIDITEGSGTWKLGQIDNYSTYLYDRLAVLDELIEDYTGDRTSAAYLAFVAERQMVVATLASYGLPPNRSDSSGRSALLAVPFIEIDPVTVSGGNITVKTTKLTGSGTLAANGAPEITVSNASNLSVRLDGMGILAPGGEVIVNTYSVKDAADLKSTVTAAKDFAGAVSADAKSGKVAAVTVKNTWNTPFVAVSVDASDNSQSGTAKFAVVSDIENRGDIRNYPGTVTLSTAVGSIRSVSADIIAGKGIKLEAPRGSITITSEGILNIDGVPEVTFKDEIERFTKQAAQEEYINDVEGRTSDVNGENLTNLLANFELNSPNHIVSGGGIYITAGVINVNGTIQSGFGTYDVSLDARLTTKIEQLKQQWDGTALPDDPSQLAAYVLVSEDIAWDADRGAYVCNPAAWYNPSTGKIVVDDMVGAGGTVFLSGRVINTNYWDSLTNEDLEQYEMIRRNHSLDLPSAEELAAHKGRIIAYAGAAEIVIESELEQTIRMGEIDTGERVGRIVINDIQNVLDENGYSVKSGDSYATALVTTTYETGGTVSGTYSPQTGVRYNMSAGGQDKRTEKETQTQKFNWWQDDWDGNADHSDATSSDDVKVDLKEGATVGLLADLMNSVNYTYQSGYPEYAAWYFANNETTSESKWSDWNYDVHYNNWTHFSGTITRERIRSVGKQTTTLVSLKADNPIDVAVKTAENAGAITINAPNADVELSGQLRSTVADAGVTITTKDIVAAPEATIEARSVILNASGTIGSTDQALRLLPLQDATVYSEDVFITANAGSGMYLDVDEGSALADLTVTDGTLSLNAEGSIFGVARAADMVLTSQNGQIIANVAGSGRTELTAKAAEDISIVKGDGDLAVSRVEAGGDVRLETENGSIVDAHPNTGRKSLTDANLTAMWKKAGLISADESGSRRTAQMREENIEHLETTIRTEYATYQNVVKTLADSEHLTDDQKKALEKQRDVLSRYEGVTDVDAYIAEQKRTEGTALYEFETLDVNQGWTRDYLLYSIQDAILNPSAGTVKSNANEIIVGKNVTLKSSVSIGELGIIQTIKGGDALLSDDMAGLKALSQANPANVEWDEDTQIFTIQDTSEVGLTAELAEARAADAVLIASPKQDLVIGSVESENRGKVHLMAAGSVLLSDSAPNDAAAVRGGDMFIAAAGENVDIGSEVRPLTIEQESGAELRANAGRSVFLTAYSGDLTLGSFAARETISVETQQQGASIRMSQGQGRLNAADVRLTVNSGDIGSEERAVRVQNAESNDFSSSVTVSGAKNVWLAGQNGTLEDGWLNVNGLNVENANISSEGGLNLSGDAVVSSQGIFTAAADFVVNGKLLGGELNLIAGKNVNVLGETRGDTVTVTSGADTTLADVKAKALEAIAGRNLTAANVTSDQADLSASGDITVSGALNGSDLNITGYQNVTVHGETSGDTVTVASGADTALADVKANILAANAGGDLTTASVTANTADLTASGSVTANGAINATTLNIVSGKTIAAQNVMTEDGTLTASEDVTVNGSLTGHELTVIAGGNVTVSGETSGKNLTVRSGANTSFARVRVPLVSISAGGCVLLDERDNDMDVLNLSAASTDVYDTNDLVLNVGTIGDLNAETAGDLTAAFAEPVGNVSLTSSGGMVDITTAVRANNLAVAAKENLIIDDSVEVTETASFASSGDMLIESDVTSHTLITVSGGMTDVTGTVDTVDLTMTAGEQIRLAENVSARGDISLTSLNSFVNIESEMNASSLSVNAKGAITPKRDIFVANDTTLNSTGDIIVGGTLQSGSLTTVSGGDTTFAKSVKTGDMRATAGGDLTAKSTIEARGSLTAEADGALRLAGDATVGENLYLTAHEISVRNLNAGKFLTALSETTFDGNDLTAGEDVRVHTYGDMTFNDATAGGNAWILGLGSSAARMKFHHVKADGLDTAVLLEHGYMDYWRVTAGLDGAAAVRYFEGPKLAGTLVQGTKVRVFYPYGGSLMPKDPFHFHVIDLLQNIELIPFEYDAVNLWPPKPKLDLHTGSDDIDVNLGDYDYWLPEEAESETDSEKTLAVSGK